MSTIKSWDDVDDLVKQVGLMQIRRDRQEGRLNERLTAIKDEFAPKLAEKDQILTAMREDLESWCMAHRHEMEQAKKDAGLTWRGAFGKVAFRRCPPAISFTVKKIEKVLAALQARKLSHCIRTVEEPNKEAMALLDDEMLAAVGARRAPAEKFEVKPDFQSIATLAGE